MKKILSFLFLLTISVSSFSQISYQARVGMNISNISDITDTNPKIGFKAGVGMEYAFNDVWAIQPSLFISSKGAKSKTTVDGFSLKTTINQLYLELPVMAAARLKVSSNTNIVLSAGPYFAYGVGGKTRMQATIQGGNEFEIEMNSFGKIDQVIVSAVGYNQTVTTEELRIIVPGLNPKMKAFNRFDFGLGLGIAAEFGRIIVGMDGQFGLTQLDDSAGKPRNLNFTIGVGYKF